MWSPLCKTRLLQLFETSLIMSAKPRGCQILFFYVDSDCFAPDLKDISTCRKSARLERGDYMADVVSPLENEVSAALRNFPYRVSKVQKLPNPAVSLLFRLFRIRFAGDIHTSKFGLIAKGGPHGSCRPPLQHEISATLQNFSHVRKGQRLQTPAVWRWLQLFANQFAGDVHTSKFGPIAMVNHMTHVVPTLQNEVSVILGNFLYRVSKGQRLPNPAVCRWLRLFGTRLAGDIHTWKFGPIAKGGPHGSCGPPFTKRGFCKSSKLPSSCQQREEASESCCLALTTNVCHSICRRYPLVKIRPDSKGWTTWVMWFRALQNEVSATLRNVPHDINKARGCKILMFGCQRHLFSDGFEFTASLISTDADGSVLSCFHHGDGTRRLLYSSIVWPQLEYCSEVWSPYNDQVKNPNWKRPTASNKIYTWIS